MKCDQEYVYCLLLRKQLGDLSDPEEKLLEKVFQNDYDVWKCYMDMVKCNEVSTDLFLEDLRVESDWGEVEKILRKSTFMGKVAYYIDVILSKLYPRWLIRIVDRKLKIIKQTDPDKIFVGKIQQFFHIPIALARLFCEMAVQVGLFRRKVVIVCPKCRRIVAVYGDKSEIPDHIACKGCNGTQELSVFHADQSYRIIFYQLIRNEVITA